MANSVIKANEIRSYSILTHSSLTVTPSGEGSHLLYLQRGAELCLIGYDYWTTGYTVLFGTVPPSVTITKNANGATITIDNQRSNAIGFTLI